MNIIDQHWQLIQNKMNVAEMSSPPLLIKNLFLCIEDRRYYYHNGIDYWCSFKAIINYLFLKKRCGGSTIEQQLVREITGDKKRTLTRKIIELLLAHKLATSYDKDDILSLYLSICYMGTGIKGIEEASTIIFGKTLYQLNEFESSIIAALAKYPRPQKLQNYKKWLPKVTSRASYARYLYGKVNYKSNKAEPFQILFINKRISVFALKN